MPEKRQIPGIGPLVATAIVASIGIWTEEPVDDVVGVLKTTNGSAAESTIVIESFDPDTQQVRATVGIEHTPFALYKAVGLKSLDLANLTLPTLQSGSLQISDETLDFKLYGIKPDLLDIGVPRSFMKPGDWKPDQTLLAKRCGVDRRWQSTPISLRYPQPRYSFPVQPRWP